MVAFARKADVGHLVLFHHDPYHTDDELEALVADAQKSWGGDGVWAAWEGMTIDLDATGVSVHAAPALPV